MKLWTCAKIGALKGLRRFACVTAFDAVSARIADEAGFALVLAGDSLGNTVLGFDSTLPVTLEMMLHHTAAVARGTRDALVVADMPFMSYQASEDEGVRNAGRFLQEAGADAVKLEGGVLRVPLVKRCVANGIPVLGHIGLLPQSVLALGGYRMQGKSEAAVEALEADALALADAGVFALVLECVPEDVGERIAKACPVPVIGCGAGNRCDGSVLVFSDVVGLSEGARPAFAKQYGNAAQVMREACKAYKLDVEGAQEPSA